MADSSFSVYRKLTFIEEYIHYDLFGPKQSERNLIHMLSDRVLKICSKSTLKYELDNIRSILVKIVIQNFLLISKFPKNLYLSDKTLKEAKKCFSL